ncbi:MAG: hypothetical protein KBH94_05410 [Caldisericia bacterium]|nr:hypothetical protein [Caldisericia bacterium]
MTNFPNGGNLNDNQASNLSSNPCFNSIFNTNRYTLKEWKKPSYTYLDCTYTYDRNIGKYKVIKSGPVYKFQFPFRLERDTSKYKTGIKKKPRKEDCSYEL